MVERVIVRQRCFNERLRPIARQNAISASIALAVYAPLVDAILSRPFWLSADAMRSPSQALYRLGTRKSFLCHMVLSNVFFCRPEPTRSAHAPSPETLTETEH